MKKLLTAALVLMMSASAFATSYTALVKEVAMEDGGEGHNVILDFAGKEIALFVTRGKKVMTGGMSDKEILAVVKTAVDESKSVTAETEAKSNEIYRIRLSNK